MKKTILLWLGLIVVSFGMALVASKERLPWIVVYFICFGGILAFDVYGQISGLWRNALGFVAVYGLALNMTLASSPDVFWRGFAGIIFLISVLFEQNSYPWKGSGPLRTTVTPAIICFLLVLAQSVPFLPVEVSYGLSVLALLVGVYLELFSILRERSSLYAGSYMSAVKLAVVGVSACFYCSIYLPGIARQPPYNNLCFALPGLGILVAIVGVLMREWRRRLILFSCNWCLLVFWAALMGDDSRFFAAIAATVFGAWTVMMTDREELGPENKWEAYIKLSAWALPGTILFTMVVFLLYPSSDIQTQQGAVLWFLSLLIFWSGLSHFRFSSGNNAASALDQWQKKLAVLINLLGAGSLAGAKILSEFFSAFWTQGIGGH